MERRNVIIATARAEGPAAEAAAIFDYIFLACQIVL
jgi:hypothetical protein